MSQCNKVLHTEAFVTLSLMDVNRNCLAIRESSNTAVKTYSTFILLDPKILLLMIADFTELIIQYD